MVPRADTDTLRVIPAVAVPDEAAYQQRFADHFRHDVMRILQSLQARDTALDIFLAETEEKGNGMLHPDVVAVRRTTRLIRGATNTLVKIASDIDRRIETVEKTYQPILSILEEIVYAIIDQSSKVKCKIEDNGIDAAIDREQMWRAVFNLVNNADSALKKKLANDDTFKPEIKITVNDEKENIEISVEDNGVGIPDDAKEKIFKIGYTTQDGQHHGFGLYNVKKICNLHKGNVRFHSEPGSTKFIMTLPKGSAESTEIPILKNRLIFIVEDEKLVSELLQDLLEDKGVDTNNIVICQDMAELITALESADSSRECLAICDNNFVGIPAINGSEALVGNAENAIRLIREKYPKALAIISSGDDKIPDDDAYEKLTKPYRQNQLDALLRRMGHKLQTAKTDN